MSSRRLHLCVLAIGLLLSRTAGAQQPVSEPEELKNARNEFHDRLRIASGFLNDFYAKALGTSESYFASKGDYAQARAIKARREDFAAIGAQAAALAAPAAPTIPLLTEQARTYGVVIAKGGDLVNWRTASCGAEWTLNNTSKFVPGTYKIQFSYTMIARPAVTGSTKPAPEAATTIAYVFKESSLLAATSKNECAISLTPTTDVTPFTSEGTIQLTKPPTTLRLAATASYPGNIVTIRDVKLLQTSTSSPASPATTAPALNLREELRKLTASLGDKLAVTRRPVIDEYTRKLDALALVASKNEALADQIDSEKRRAQKTLTDINAKTPHVLENFDELDDVRFVPDPSNTGDDFKIVTKEGKDMRIRLALVSCAPKDPAAREMKLVTERFGIDVDAALQLATDAQEFTAGYLHDRTLRVLIRHTRKSDEVPYALVFLDDIGLFQSVLITHGLAVVDAPSGASKASNREGEYVAMLREREAQTRKQTPPPGGWGLSLNNR